MEFYAIREKNSGRFFVGTGGYGGGSTASASRAKNRAPKLYPTLGSAKGTVTMVKNSHRYTRFPEEYEIVPVTLVFGDPL